MNKRHQVFFILVVLLLPWWSVAQSISEIKADQKQFIGAMSGEYPIADGYFLKARSSKEEREMTRAYLIVQLRNIGLAPQIRSYQMPNLNPLIDLLFSPFTGANVFATLPATTASSECVVLGAHFDSESGCPGAIDNASGSALILSVVKHLKAIDHRSKNIIIVFFDQEEEELVGSQAFARYLRKQQLDVHSVHTFDMVGWDENGDGEMELEMPTPYLEEVYRAKAAELGVPVYTANINSTDHHSFRKVGYPAIGVNEAYGKRDTSPYKDTPKDTFDTVNFDYLAASTLFVLEVMKEFIK